MAPSAAFVNLSSAAEGPTDIVVIPQNARLVAAEAALSLALVAMIGGTRPAVTTALVREHLRTCFGITEVSVSRHVPQDFIVRFASRDDLELVLGTPVLGGPFTLIWSRWSRHCTASPGSFRYKVVVGMKGVPAHVRCVESAQIILGNSCAKIEAEALDDLDDEREFFVAEWCIHPKLIPNEKVIAVPEPEVHDPCGVLCLRPEEVIHAHLPALRYPVQLRIVEVQDWHTPPTSSDDEAGWGRRDEDDDSGDSNYNGYHPGLDDHRSRSSRAPRTLRFGNAGNGGGPTLGGGYGPTFRPRQNGIVVGDVLCPLPQLIAREASGGRTKPAQSVDTTVQTQCAGPVPTPVRPDVAQVVTASADPPLVGGALTKDPIQGKKPDPMDEEAAMQVSIPMIQPSLTAAMAPVDADPAAAVARSGGIRGFLEPMLVGDVGLMAGVGKGKLLDPCDGPALLLVPKSTSPGFETSSWDPCVEFGPGLSNGPLLPLLDFDGPGAQLVEVVAQVDSTIGQASEADVDLQRCAGDAISAFVDSISVELSPPLLVATPVQRVTKALRAAKPDACFVPKRSARLAAKSGHRASKPEEQVRRVLLAKFGEHVEVNEPDHVTFEEFHQLFRSPLPAGQEEAVRELIPGRFASPVALPCVV